MNIEKTMIQYFRKPETIQCFVLSIHPFIITLILVLIEINHYSITVISNQGVENASEETQKYFALSLTFKRKHRIRLLFCLF